ncbi:MAG TPA: glycosyltransferase family 4 protein [Geminicoccaceae bacterium]|nr:glycosyltransferase family 4 protein [Geminicoccaceae bacterium]
MQLLPRFEGGGVERTAMDVARWLVREGWRSVVVSAGGRLERELAGSGVHHVTLPVASKNPLVMALNVGRIARVARRFGVEVIHAHSRAPAWSGAFAARRTGAAFMTSFHGVYRGHQRRFKRRYNAIMTAGDRVIAVSEHVAEHVAATYRVEPERIRIVHPGVDLQEFDPARVRGHRIAPLADKWHLGFGQKVVMLPGRVTRIKGHLLLLRAMAQMARDDFLAVIVGPMDQEGSYLREIEKAIRAAGLGERVRFGGDCADMPAALMLADVVALPAIGPEAFGRVVVEAQAMGRPVVVTDMGALAEAMQPAATGWLVRPDDPGELAWALDLALSLEGDVKARLAERARAFAADSFAAERSCARTAAIYRELVRRAPAPAAVPEPEPQPG